MPDVLWCGCAAVLHSVLKAVFTIKWRMWTGRCCASQHASEDPGISVWLQRHHPQCPHGNQTCRGCLREKTQLSKCLKANETTKGQLLLPTLFPSSYPSSQWLWTIKDGPSGGACHLYGAEVRERDFVFWKERCTLILIICPGLGWKRGPCFPLLIDAEDL